MYNILNSVDILKDFFKNYVPNLVGNFDQQNTSIINSIIRFKENKNILKKLNQKYPSFFTKIIELFYLSKLSIDDILKQIFCINCGKKLKFNKISKPFLQYCSNLCACKGEQRRNKVKETVKNKDFTERNEKSRKTKLERYGNEYYNNRNKAAQTYLEKYGTDSILKSEEIRDKIKKTNIQRYGVDNPFKSEQIQQQIKETNIEKYGVENVFQSETIKDKIKKTNLEKYGVDHYAKTDESKLKFKINSLKKYGTDNPFQSCDIKEKIKETNNKKYNVDYPMQSQLIKEKSRQTSIEKYDSSTSTSSHIKNREDINVEFINKKFVKNNMIDLEELTKYFNCSLSFYQQTIKPLFNDQLIKKSKCNKTQKNIFNFVTSLGVDVKYNDRTIIKPKELDIFIPEYNVAIEYNGLMFHSIGMSHKQMFDNHTNEDKIKMNHYNKFELCKNNNIHLLHIFDHHWYQRNKQIKSLIKRYLNKLSKIDIGSCNIDVIDNHTITEQFIKENSIHINYEKYDYSIALFNDNNILAILLMRGYKDTYSFVDFIQRNDIEIENSFLCLLHKFSEIFKCKYISISFDRSLHDPQIDNISHIINKIGNTSPDYFLIDEKLNIVQKDKIYLKNKEYQYNYFNDLYNQGFRKVYDCGKEMYEIY